MSTVLLALSPPDNLLLTLQPGLEPDAELGNHHDAVWTRHQTWANRIQWGPRRALLDGVAAKQAACL